MNSIRLENYYYYNLILITNRQNIAINRFSAAKENNISNRINNLKKIMQCF